MKIIVSEEIETVCPNSVVDAEASVVVLIIGEVQFLCLEAQLKGSTWTEAVSSTAARERWKTRETAA